MFERLTFTAEQREADNLGDAQYFSPEMCAKIDKRLFEYENTGLTPDEVLELVEKYNQLVIDYDRLYYHMQDLDAEAQYQAYENGQ